MNIGNQTFEKYHDYELAYIKKWEQVHPTLPVDLNWAKKDWEMRINRPDLYK